MAQPPCSPGSISKGTFKLPVERPIRPMTSCSSSQGSRCWYHRGSGGPSVRACGRIPGPWRPWHPCRDRSRSCASAGDWLQAWTARPYFIVAGEGRVVLVRERQVGTAQLAGDLVGVIPGVGEAEAGIAPPQSIT